MLKRHPVTQLTLLSLLGVASACVGRPAGLPVQLHLTALPTSTVRLDDSAERTQTPTPRPATATPDDDIARLVRNLSAEETTVKVTGYVHAIVGRSSDINDLGLRPRSRSTPTGPRSARARRCPLPTGLRLYDRAIAQNFRSTLMGVLWGPMIPETSDWLAIAIDPDDPSPLLSPRGEYESGLPIYGRYRLRLRDPRYSDCPDAHKVAVLLSVEPLGDERWDDYGSLAPFFPSASAFPPGWATVHDGTLGITLRMPANWRIENGEAGALLRSPDWPTTPLSITLLTERSFEATKTSVAGQLGEPWRETHAVGRRLWEFLATPAFDRAPQPVYLRACAPRRQMGPRGLIYSPRDGCIAAALPFPDGRHVLQFQQSYGVGDEADPRILESFDRIVLRVDLDGRPTITPPPALRNAIGSGPLVPRATAEAEALETSDAWLAVAMDAGSPPAASAALRVRRSELLSEQDAWRTNRCGLLAGSPYPGPDEADLPFVERRSEDAIWSVELRRTVGSKVERYFVYVGATSGAHICMAPAGRPPRVGAPPGAR